MAKLTLTIPDDKVDLIVSAVNHHLDLEEDLTPQEVLDWLKGNIRKTALALVRNYREYVLISEMAEEDLQLS